ncbi:MAG: FAD:protein FMN transferase [Gammaproteobacteria bacterium]|nr:FAD:protein FMN transferase [Gammaproteobacteria bacterium]
MGTEYLLKIADRKAAQEKQRISETVTKLLSDINQAMSTYIEDSELSRINRAPATDWIPVSDELWEVLLEADRISRLSNGAFDITVGPLVNLWGFGPRKVTADMLPDENTISRTMQTIGYKHIEYNPEGKKIRKNVPDLYIDLSGIAKGYAVDRIADILDALGYKNYMIEIGGELRVKGRRSADRGWQVGIEKPLVDRRSVHRVIRLQDTGMATSGDYRNFFEIDGKRYSHTIDPNTGNPVTHELASVSVLHDSAMTADALATALNVMGAESGIQLAEERGITAMFIKHSGKEFDEKFTGGFDRHILNTVLQ